MSQQQTTVAAFDFDGTLTRRDTLLPFLYYCAGPLAFVRDIARSAPALTAYGLGLMKNDVAKERVLTKFVAGTPLATLQRQGQAFARDRLPGLVRSVAVRRLQWHQQRGHRTVIISASLDVYLKPWAAALGVDHLLCTSLETNDSGLVSGRLGTANCYGPEKLRRLQQALGDGSDYVLYAYGDSRGDRELLASADHSFYRIMPGAPETKE
jgi:phosphatidylglycerophosphatase C